jgi:hypothetical protein
VKKETTMMTTNVTTPRVLACGAAALALTVFSALSIAEPTAGYRAGLLAAMTPVVTVVAEEATTRVAQAATSVLLD